jgi:GMP synthase PP-ATPase subunit
MPQRDFLARLKGVEILNRREELLVRNLDVFMEEAQKIGRFDFLAQGTLVS